MRSTITMMLTLAALMNGCGSGGEVPVVYNDNNNINQNDNVNPGNTGGNDNNGGGDTIVADKGRLQVNLTVLAPPPAATTRQDTGDTVGDTVGAPSPVNYKVTVNAHLRDTAENLTSSETIPAGEEKIFFGDPAFVGVWEVIVDVKTDATVPVLITSTTPVPVTVIEGKTAILPLTVALPAEGDVVILTTGEITQF